MKTCNILSIILAATTVVPIPVRFGFLLPSANKFSFAYSMDSRIATTGIFIVFSIYVNIYPIKDFDA